MSKEHDGEPRFRDVYFVQESQIGALGSNARAEGNAFEQTYGERPPSDHREARVAPSRLPHSVPKLFGRGDELAQLEVAWNDPKTHLMTLVAWGGVGKTSLVAAWTAEMAARDYDGADYFDWSFYSQGTGKEAGHRRTILFLLRSASSAMPRWLRAQPQRGTRVRDLLVSWPKGRHSLCLTGSNRFNTRPGR